MNDDRSDGSADLRVGYQVAVHLMTYEGQLQWWMTAAFIPFAAFVLVAAIFPSFIGVTNPKIIAVVATAFSFIGIAVTFMWWSMVSRSRKYYRYWISSARELEKKLHGSVKTLQRGRKLKDTQTVDGEDLVFQRHERILVGDNLKVFYLTFFTTFVLLLVWNIVRVVLAF